MGFPQELVLNSKVDEEFICAICCEVFSNPVQVEGCEDVFCKSCIEDWINKSGGHSCPLCRQPVTEIKAAPRKFINMVHKLQVRCEFHNFGCNTIVALGDIINHQACCGANPDLWKSCPHDCGATLRKTDTADHNCIEYLKTTIDELKLESQKRLVLYKSTIKERHTLAIQEFKKSELKLKSTQEELNKEIELLKSKIEDLALTKSNATDRSNKKAIQSWTDEVSNRQVLYEMNIEMCKLYSRVQLGMSAQIPGNDFNNLRTEIDQAKKRVHDKKEFLDKKEYKWMDELTGVYEKLEKALSPMPLEIETDVLRKYGESLHKNFKEDSNENWLRQIDQEMDSKYGGKFFSNVSQVFVSERYREHFLCDESVCQVELFQCIKDKKYIRLRVYRI